jgi:ATP-binding cassette subfamily C protein LapB
MRLQTILQDKTLILVTHKANLLSLVNRVIIVDEGKIIADGPKDIIFKSLTEGSMRKPSE